MFSNKKMKGLQQQYSALMSDISSLSIEGKSSGDLVCITLSGQGQLQDIKISPDCVDPEETEALEDLIKEAYASASEQLQAKMSAMMPGMGGLGL